MPLAHALVAESDLPLPDWLFAWAAATVLIISFFALSAAWRRPILQDDGWRAVDNRLAGLITHPLTRLVTGVLGVLLLVLTVYAGLAGTSAPDRNFALTFVFVTVWLGFPFLSVFLGDIFPAFNPWRAMGRVSGRLFKAVAGQEPAHLSYPERLGRWPAAAGVAALVWLELVHGSVGIAVGLDPATVGTAAIVYSVYTLAMMGLFGTEAWCRNGELFSVYFNMFSQLGVFEARDGRLGRRKPLAAAGQWAKVPGSVAVVLTSVATTTFDGAQGGFLRGAIESLYTTFLDAGFSPTWGLRTADTIFMALTVLLVVAIWVIGVRGMRTVRGAPSFRDLSTSFCHSLIPIAFAYLLAHYFSLFVYQMQAQFTFLLSDPLGTGTTDLFGTAGSGIDYGVVGPNAIWYIQVAALVIGHVLGLTLAHDRAVAKWQDYRDAARSQYWMLGVMVAFTCLGLFLLSAHGS